jgi:hypothetical protein
MSPTFMICRGAVTSSGAVNLRGSYAAGSGPDWGWRTVIEPTGRRSFRMLMYNIAPASDEVLAVDARYGKGGPKRRLRSWRSKP